MQKSQKRKLETDEIDAALSDLQNNFLEQIFPVDLLSVLKPSEKLELLKLIFRISTAYNFESVS